MKHVFCGTLIVLTLITMVNTICANNKVVHPEFVNDFENNDYNNAYYNVTVLREEKT